VVSDVVDDPQILLDHDGMREPRFRVVPDGLAIFDIAIDRRLDRVRDRIGPFFSVRHHRDERLRREIGGARLAHDHGQSGRQRFEHDLRRRFRFAEQHEAAVVGEPFVQRLSIPDAEVLRGGVLGEPAARPALPRADEIHGDAAADDIGQPSLALARAHHTQTDRATGAVPGHTECIRFDTVAEHAQKPVVAAAQIQPPDVLRQHDVDRRTQRIGEEVREAGLAIRYGRIEAMQPATVTRHREGPLEVRETLEDEHLAVAVHEVVRVPIGDGDHLVDRRRVGDVDRVAEPFEMKLALPQRSFDGAMAGRRNRQLPVRDQADLHEQVTSSGTILAVARTA
jgi:hypothetical protein